jgi:hypothetical protein
MHMANSNIPEDEQKSKMDPMLQKYLTSKYGDIGIAPEVYTATNDNQLLANLARAGGVIGSSIAGTKLDDQGYQNLAATAKAPMDQAKLAMDAQSERRKVADYLIERDSKLKEMSMRQKQYDDTRAYTKAKDDRDYKLELAKLGDKKAQEGKGEKLPASTALEMGDIKSVNGSINALGDYWDTLASKQGSGLSQFIPGTDANLYNDTRNAKLNEIAKAIEGRAPTEGDIKRYDEMMPKSTDTKAKKENRITQLKEYAARKFNERKKALAGSGYNIQGLGEDIPLPEKTKASTDGTATAATTPEKRPGHVRMKKGNESYDIPADNKRAIEASKAAGFVEE